MNVISSKSIIQWRYCPVKFGNTQILYEIPVICYHVILISGEFDFRWSYYPVKFIYGNTQIPYRMTYIKLKFYFHRCGSLVGMKGGRQNLMLAPACLVDRTIKHEFLHALGLHHEHNRVDRDLFIDVHYGNIQNGIVFYFFFFIKLACIQTRFFATKYYDCGKIHGLSTHD